MLRKTLSVLLTFSLWCCTSRLGLAQTSSTTNPSTAIPQVNTKQERLAERVKAHIAKLGTGPGARIELRLRDKMKVKGHVSHLDEHQFVVADDQTGITTRMTYGQVIHIKGENFNKDKEIAIGIVLGLMLLFGAGSLKGGP